jgi:glycerol-3-phosphate cytidylyltransferase-like family protein
VDTRIKIVGAEEARVIASQGATIVSGYFDPLIASHAERLAGLKRPGASLLILIATAENEILPARARAELVASLAVVDYVCETAEAFPPHISLEQEHDEVRAQLIRHVQARQRAASAS